MPYPEGHAWGLALFLEPADPELMWRLADRPYVTLPDDLKYIPVPEQEEGLVFEVLDRVCVKCWQRFDMVVWEPCQADTDPLHHLHGGVMAERAPRTKPAPGTTAKEVAARQARARQKRARRETVALMQASRIDGLN
ncbi:hypothetical protein [Nonomuraea candida]|uniref:hypothetical protein n=1 Tax=Nonomuraea candida TaxID=359159 RepID=UPI0005BCD07E|nr:hypothetical protein [Nonomuraea candida]